MPRDIFPPSLRKPSVADRVNQFAYFWVVFIAAGGFVAAGYQFLDGKLVGGLSSAVAAAVFLLLAWKFRGKS